MNFSLNEEQNMLKDAVSRLLSDEYDFDRREARRREPAGYDENTWQQFAEQGWLAMLFAEDVGGFGGGPVETMIFMEQFGRHLVVEPFLSNVILAGGLLARCNEEQRQRWLSPMMAGELKATLAWVEPQARYDLANVETAARLSGGSVRINGSKAVVPHADTADILIVPAVASTGVELYAIPANSQGISMRPYPTIDGLRAAEVAFDDVEIYQADRLALKDAPAALAAVIDEATLAVSAEAVGIMDALLEKTVDYARERKQFGRPIASFQALQHRMVDMLMAVEQSRSLLLHAVIAAKANDEVGAAIAALKHYVGTAGRRLGEEAVQIHGGMGVTDELDVAHYFKRLVMIDTQFGNADFQLQRLL